MQDMRKWCCLLILTFLLSGCGMQTQESERLKDLDFTVMDLEKVPEELRDVLEEKKSMPFKVTYEDDGYLYICVGYGEQDTSGYSIAVEDLYLTDNAICVFLPFLTFPMLSATVLLASSMNSSTSLLVGTGLR